MNAALRLAATSLAALALAGCKPAPDALAYERNASPPPVQTPISAALNDAGQHLALQALAARVAALESQRQNASASGAAAPAAVPDARTSRRPTEAEMRAGPPGSDAAPPRDPQQHERERQAQLDTLFRQEPVNTDWANTTAEAVRHALPAPVDGQALALRGVECRSQTCRVEVGAAGAEAMRQGLPQLAERLAERFPSLSVVARNDGTAATLYFRT